MENINQREAEFKVAVFNFHEYGETLLNQFYLYWSEKNTSGKKMRFEMEKTWDLSRRLQRWFNNQKQWNNGKPVSSTVGRSIVFDKL